MTDETMAQVDALLRELIDANVITVHDGSLPYAYAFRLPPAVAADWPDLIEPYADDGTYTVGEDRFGIDGETGQRTRDVDAPTAQRLLGLLRAVAADHPVARTPQQLTVELARLQAEYGRASRQGGGARQYVLTTLHVRIETLRWALGIASTFDDERR